MHRAAIKAVTSYFPEGELTNARLAEEFGDFTAEKIFDKTGISVRRIAAEDECSSDLGIGAALRLFDRGACSAEDVDFLILVTQSADYLVPTTACTMQDRLGLRTDCGAIDMNQGCSGYVYGLALAKSLVEAKTARNVLLITADTFSKHLNARDRS